MENRKRRYRWSISHGVHLVAMQVALMVAFPFIPGWPPQSVPQPSTMFGALRWTTLVLCLTIAAILGSASLLTLGRNLTPLPYPVEDNELVESGVFRIVRHPLYAAIMIAFGGWTLFTMSLLHLVMAIAGIVLLERKASKEEAWLTERHPEYRDYAARTGKFIPKLRKSGLKG